MKLKECREKGETWKEGGWEGEERDRERESDPGTPTRTHAYVYVQRVLEEAALESSAHFQEILRKQRLSVEG